MSTDPFSDVLRLTEARSVVSGGFTAAGRWALRFPPPEKLKFFLLERGVCWLRVEGEKKAVSLRPGDVFLASGRKGFLLASDLSAAAKDARRVFGPSGTCAELGGSDTLLVGGHVSLHPSSGTLLSDVLPALILVQAASPYAETLRWILGQLIQERDSPQPGSGAVLAQLAQLMFVQVLRAHLASGKSLRAGWLRAIADPRIAPALRLMHSQPGRAWKLSDFAKAAAMSRSSFAERFKAAAGVAPLEYLTGWRMRLAQKSLRDEDRTVLDLAASLGYSSESSFSNAFKRVIGASPSKYRSAARQQQSSV